MAPKTSNTLSSQHAYRDYDPASARTERLLTGLTVLRCASSNTLACIFEPGVPHGPARCVLWLHPPRSIAAIERVQFG